MPPENPSIFQTALFYPHPASIQAYASHLKNRPSETFFSTIYIFMLHIDNNIIQ